MKGYRLTPMERSCYRILWRRRIKSAANVFKQDPVGISNDTAAYLSDLFFVMPKIDGGWLRRKKMAQIDKAWSIMSAKCGGFDYKKTATWAGGGYGVLPIRAMSEEQLRAEYYGGIDFADKADEAF